MSQSRLPEQVIVVDSSTDDLTKQVVSGFPEALYVRHENGWGKMTRSRNIGLRHATGQIIAFVDDDAFAHTDWLEHLIATYTDDKIGAVGGRALNNRPGEESEGVDDIGKITSSAKIQGYFAADPGQTIEVQHIIGCNMSFRRTVLAALGGFREDCAGVGGQCEDTDMCIRVGRLGYKLLFNPRAVVTHIGAPQVVGRRFDFRYVFYTSRNLSMVIVRNYGALNPMLRRYVARVTWEAVVEFVQRYAAAIVRLIATVSGITCGIIVGHVLLFRVGRDPVRHDSEADELKVRLGSLEMSERLPANR
jgi:GT2 family glycosyltransferase